MSRSSDRPPIRATEALVDWLLEVAAERDPTAVSVPLDTTPASAFDDLNLPASTPIFSHAYLPDAGRSLSAVFGVDLSTPAGGSPGIFVSHPSGVRDIERTDTLREVVLIAVPPWEPSDVGAYSRDGASHPLDLVDAIPPEETPP